MTEPAAPSPSPSPTGRIKLASSLIKRARAGEQQAIVTIFRQFIPEGEEIYWAEYLGRHGWIFGRLSFGALTNRRVAAVKIGLFGEVVYQDGYLEYVNSGVVYQPSRLALYIWVFFGLIFTAYLSGAAASLVTYGISPSYENRIMVTLIAWIIVFALLTPVIINFVVRMYYAVRKCGLVLWIKDGISVYVFADRKRLLRANTLYRMVTDIRDKRIRNLGHLG